MRPVFALLVLALCSLPAIALAHAEPARVTPGDGAVLNHPPGTVEILMTQEMARESGANDIDVFDAAGKEVTTISAVIDNGNRKRLTVTLPSALVTGAYRVEWKTLSADDGDAANGTLGFTVDPGAAPNPGKVRLKEAANPATTPSGVSGAQPLQVGGPGDGNSWVTTVALSALAFALGSGATYLLVVRRP